MNGPLPGGTDLGGGDEAGFHGDGVVAVTPGDGGGGGRRPRLPAAPGCPPGGRRRQVLPWPPHAQSLALQQHKHDETSCSSCRRPVGGSRGAHSSEAP